MPFTRRDALSVSLACRDGYPTEADGPADLVVWAARQAPTLQWLSGIGSARRIRADQRWRPGHRARSARSRPFRPAVVGPAAGGGPAGDRRGARGIFPRRCHDRDDGQLPGIVRGLCGARNRPTRSRRAVAPQRRTRQGRARRSRRERSARGRLGRPVRRGAGRRLRISRPLRTVRRGFDAVASAPARGPGRRRRGRARPGNRARCRRGRGAGQSGSLGRGAGLAQLHHRRDRDARGATARRRVRGGRRRSRDCRHRRQLLRARRRAARDRHGEYRQTGDRLPEQRGALGRGGLDRAAQLFRATRRAVGRGWGKHHRWLLSGGARRHCGCSPSVLSARRISGKFALVHVRRIVRRSARRASGTPGRCR